MTKNNIFLSYRRDDSEAETRNIRYALQQAGHNVFMDTLVLQGGDRWPDRIENALNNSDVVIVVIGDKWLTAQNAEGRRRIDGEEDWIHLEIKTALRSEKKIIPVLFNGARIPLQTSLPDDIKELSNHQALIITRENWENDLQILLQEVSSGIKDGQLNPKTSVSDSVEQVAFTAYHAKEGRVLVWHQLLVYIHTLSAVGNVQQDALGFIDRTKVPKETTYTSLTRLSRGTEITIIPSCEGITFNPERINVKWMEDYQRSDFRFRADQSLLGNAAMGQIDFFVGPLIVGSLKFAMLFNASEAQLSFDDEEHSEMYHRDAIFVSYSHKDTKIVDAFKLVHQATGFDVLIDIDNLRSGQKWNSELMRMIDRADIFQLFWSTNSKESKFCKQEWKHALKRGKEGFIRPVYWRKPLPKPPKELSEYHFEYVELKK